MSNKIVIAVIVVLIGGIGFYAGDRYGQNAKLNTNGQSANAAFSARFNQNNGTAGGGIRTRGGSGFVSGQIISSDSKSLTVKLDNGGSQIVFLTASTTISRELLGTVTDLKSGVNITANGVTNTDGSINAKSIQLRATNGNYFSKQQ